MWEEWAQTCGFDDDICCFGIILDFLGSSSPFFCSKRCLGTDDCNFEVGGFCTPGMEFFAPGAKAFFSMVATCFFKGKPLGPIGRPGPFPILLPSCFLGSTEVKLGLLAEVNLLDPVLECDLPFTETVFLSSCVPWRCLPLLPKGCLLFNGTWVDRASSTSAKNLYKFSQWNSMI